MYYRYAPASCHDGNLPPPCVGGHKRRRKLFTSIRAEGTEMGQQTFRSFHSQLTSKRSQLSGNGPRGYDYEPYLRSHLSFHEMRVAILPLLIHEINLSYRYLIYTRVLAFRKSGHGYLQ